MNRVIITVLFLGLNMACSNSPNSNTAQEKTDLDPLPLELFQNLVYNVDFVDYTFYTLPISMSYDSRPTILSALNWVIIDNPTMPVNCQALGRMIFQSKGTIIMEAEIFIEGDCAHYKWFVENKPMYVSTMKAQGKEHYQGIFRSVQNQNNPS